MSKLILKLKNKDSIEIEFKSQLPEPISISYTSRSYSRAELNGILSSFEIDDQEPWDLKLAVTPALSKRQRLKVR